MSQPPEPSNISVGAFVRDTTPINSDGKVVCYEHWEPARRLTSRTLANPGRDFFACSKTDWQKCTFFIWADDIKLLAMMLRQSKEASASATSPPQPERPSQARRAQFARSPTTPMSVHKRPRTPSPSPVFSSAEGNMTPKQRKTEGGTFRHRTPLTPSQRAARQAEIEKGLSEANQQKITRLASIEAALSAVQGTSQEQPPSPSCNVQSQASTCRSSRNQFTGAAFMEVQQQRSDASPSPSITSLSQNRTLQPPPSQSDAGYSITSEIDEAERDELEDKAIQTDPIDDEEETIYMDFESSPLPRSLMGSPVALSFALGGTDADAGAGPSRAPLSRLTGSEDERGSWTPAPPSQPPGRGRSTRNYTPGENEGGTLPTPPGSSQTDNEVASLRGRLALPQRRAESPSSPTKGKGREERYSASPRGSMVPQWQMIQDDPENPFHEGAAALAFGAGPSTSIISGPDNVSGNGSWPSGPLSADVIASQLDSLAGVPEYVRRLERRERAAQNSAEIKARRIEQLEEENQRLLNEKRALEETISALRVRR